ncbi:MAG: type II/IV secretion system protein [Methyloprofundus sp.]|nr:type II/IV secretion system protein [Methyloprofundus sp.]
MFKIVNNAFVYTGEFDHVAYMDASLKHDLGDLAIVQVSKDEFLAMSLNNDGEATDVSKDREIGKFDKRGSSLSPAVDTVNSILKSAISSNASDVHIEPFEDETVVRARIDGVLKIIDSFDSNLSLMVSSRIKIMSGLDISETRLPQDGRISFAVDEGKFDLRVSFIPVSSGERIVIRILDKRSEKLSIDGLGMPEKVKSIYRDFLAKKHGVVILSGPTGSGKTTTLYAGIEHVKDEGLNIMTIEDPVEYDLKGISQTQVNEKVGMTFSSGLRSILRQDPDVLMIGEIRDPETAKIAIQSSLTGHLVLTTLHTNTSAGSVARLVDMGLDPVLISASISGVISQRLLRVLCKECKEEVDLEDYEREFSGGLKRAFKACGCKSCNGTGYKGQAPIYEVLIIDSNIKKLIHQKASEEDLFDSIVEKGLTLKGSALSLVKSGHTSIDEVLRGIGFD